MLYGRGREIRTPDPLVPNQFFLLFIKFDLVILDAIELNRINALPNVMYFLLYFKFDYYIF